MTIGRIVQSRTQRIDAKFDIFRNLAKGAASTFSVGVGIVASGTADMSSAELTKSREENESLLVVLRFLALVMVDGPKASMGLIRKQQTLSTNPDVSKFKFLMF